MSYMLLVIERPGDRSARSAEAGRVLCIAAIPVAELKKRGLLTMSQALKSDAAAVRVTAPNGKPIVRDGR